MPILISGAPNHQDIKLRGSHGIHPFTVSKFPVSQVYVHVEISIRGSQCGFSVAAAIQSRVLILLGTASQSHSLRLLSRVLMASQYRVCSLCDPFMSIPSLVVIRCCGRLLSRGLTGAWADP